MKALANQVNNAKQAPIGGSLLRTIHINKIKEIHAARSKSKSRPQISRVKFSATS